MQRPKPVRHIGLDVHKKWTQVAMIDDAGQVLLEDRIASTPEQWRLFAAKLTCADRVALEATGFTWAIVALLEQHAGAVVVSNPLRTRLIAETHCKTDKVDARTLADLLRCNYLPPVWRPDAQTMDWRAAVRFRDRFVRRRTQLKNQIHSIFHRNLLVFEGSDLFGTTGRRWMAEKRAALNSRDQFELDVLLEELGPAEQRVTALDHELARAIWRHPDVRLLITIPGVDYFVAVSLLAAVGDITRFSSAKKLASYFGLVSKVSQSGEKCFLGPITKHGRSHGRWVAIQAAQQLCRAHGPIRQFYERIKKRKGHNVAVVAVARKLIVLVWHILTKREPYRYSQPRRTHDKLARLRILATGQKKKTGPAAGTPLSANYGTGRQVKFAKSLNEVYAENHLPTVKALPKGEQKMLSARHLHLWAQHNINQPTVILRKPKTPSKGKDKADTLTPQARSVEASETPSQKEVAFMQD